jgi:tetratricopeptide (TPR) repeat protein
VNRLLGDAREAVAAEKWVSALGAVDQVLKIDPANVEAKKIYDQANAEFRNHSTYQDVVKARDNNKAPEVAKLAREIPDSSIYKAKALADLEKMHDQYVREREADAKSLSAKGQCDKIGPLARRAAEVFPDAKAAVEKAGAGCVQAIAASPPEPATEKPPAPSAAPTEAELGALVSEAREEARNGNWAEARKKADDVLRHRPTDQDALSVAGIAACNLLDKDRAMKYIDRLKGNRQTMMKQICATKGLTIE